MAEQSVLDVVLQVPAGGTPAQERLRIAWALLRAAAGMLVAAARALGQR